MITVPETQIDQQKERPGTCRQTESRTAETDHQKEAPAMTNTTPVPPDFAPTGHSISDLEALAETMGIRIEDVDELPGNNWGIYSPRYQLIRLLSRLAPIQRRFLLAGLVAHAHLKNYWPNGYEDYVAEQLAAQMVITRRDWQTIGPVWEDCKDTDPQKVFHKCQVMTSMVRAYADAEKIHDHWHPEECIDWVGLCNLESVDDDIHGFAPVPLQVADGSAVVTKTVTGSAEGQYPVEIGMELALRAPILRDRIAHIHFNPREAREFANFLLTQADEIDAWAMENSHYFKNEPDATPEGSDELIPALAGGAVQ